MKDSKNKRITKFGRYSVDLGLFIVFTLYFQCVPHFHYIAFPPLSLCSLMETELTSLCQSVLEDFNLVLFYLPPPTHGAAHHSPSEEEEEQQQQHADSSCPVLPDTLVFKMVVTCLMVVHSLKRGGQCQCDVVCFAIFFSVNFFRAVNKLLTILKSVIPFHYHLQWACISRSSKDWNNQQKRKKKLARFTFIFVELCN